MEGAHILQTQNMQQSLHYNTVSEYQTVYLQPHAPIVIILDWKLASQI
jgi:hypothetical protein